MAPRKRLGELLVAAGVLDEARLTKALAEQRKWGGRLGRTLVELGFVDEVTMCAALSRQLQLPAIDLANASLPGNVTQFLPVDVCERYGVMPVSADRERRQLRIATSDPTNLEALRDIGVRSRLKVEPLVATSSDIDRAIRRYYYGEKTSGPPAGPKPTPRGDAAPSLAKIEEMLTTQMKALRVLVEMLVDKGVISREDYLARMKGKG